MVNYTKCEPEAYLLPNHFISASAIADIAHKFFVPSEWWSMEGVEPIRSKWALDVREVVEEMALEDGYRSGLGSKVAASCSSTQEDKEQGQDSFNFQCRRRLLDMNYGHNCHH